MEEEEKEEEEEEEEGLLSQMPALWEVTKTWPYGIYNYNKTRTLLALVI